MMSLVRPALALLALFTVLTGPRLPGAGHRRRPARCSRTQANGSLIAQGGKVVGSHLIGQPFADPRYFWSRPSATGPHAYNAAASTGSNQGPLNPALHEAVTARIAALRAADPGQQAPVPVDLVTASGSGLDPHISPAAALYQVARVAHARGLPAERVRQLVAAHTEGRDLGLLGEPRVNVLALNLALDSISQARKLANRVSNSRSSRSRTRRPTRPRRAAAAGAGRGSAGEPRQAEDLLRLRARRRQDLRMLEVGARLHAQGVDVVVGWSRPTAATRPRRCCRASTCCRGARSSTAAPRSRSSTSTRRSRAAPRCSCSTSSRTPTRPARATPSAGRTCSSCSTPASTSTPRSTCSTSRA